MENYKKLIERMKTDAEWAEANEWESPICLYDDLIGAIKAIEALTAELVDERHRHDRLQDFEVAEAKELEQIKAERDALIEEIRGKCDLCAHYNKGSGDWGCTDCTGGNFQWRGLEGK